MDVASKPFTCSACGGLVPLGEEAVATCPFCQASLPLPPEFLALREAGRVLQAERDEARDCYRKLVIAPRWLQKLALIESVVGIIAIGAPIVTLFAIDRGQHVVARLLRALAPLLGVDVLDRYGWMTPMTSIGLAALALIMIPLTVSLYAGAFEDVRKQLLSAYAARPPATPTGPSTCRSCGAALDVQRHELGVVCLYCRSHNLVGIPAEEIKAAEGKAIETQRKIDAAVASLDDARRKGWGAVRGALRSAFGLLVAFSIFLIGILVSGKEEDGADTVATAIATSSPSARASRRAAPTPTRTCSPSSSTT